MHKRIKKRLSLIYIRKNEFLLKCRHAFTKHIFVYITVIFLFVYIFVYITVIFFYKYLYIVISIYVYIIVTYKFRNLSRNNRGRYCVIINIG